MVCSFITYRAVKHLDRKHTIFGRVVGGLETLARLENAPTEAERPVPAIAMRDLVVFVDPFAEFQKQKRERDEQEHERDELLRAGGADDEKTTWTGKRLRAADGGAAAAEAGDGLAGVGRYLKAVEPAMADDDDDEIVREVGNEDALMAAEPVKKKVKNAGGFGNFDGW